MKELHKVGIAETACAKVGCRRKFGEAKTLSRSRLRSRFGKERDPSGEWLASKASAATRAARRFASSIRNRQRGKAARALLMMVRREVQPNTCEARRLALRTFISSVRIALRNTVCATLETGSGRTTTAVDFWRPTKVRWESCNCIAASGNSFELSIPTGAARAL